MKITENQLKRIIKESVKKVLNEELSDEEVAVVEQLENSREFAEYERMTDILIQNNNLFRWIDAARKYTELLNNSGLREKLDDDYIAAVPSEETLEDLENILNY